MGGWKEGRKNWEGVVQDINLHPLGTLGERLSKADIILLFYNFFNSQFLIYVESAFNSCKVFSEERNSPSSCELPYSSADMTSAMDGA